MVKSLVLLLISLLSLLPVRARAEYARLIFWDLSEVLRTECAGPGEPAFGEPVPDGVWIEIIWDWNHNGFSLDDIQVPECDEPPVTPVRCGNFARLPMNGEAGLGAGLFYSESAFIWQFGSGMDQFYLQISLAGGWYLVSDTFTLEAGDQVMEILGWECQPATDHCNHMGLTQASGGEPRCDGVHIAWGALDSTRECQGYVISRGGTPIHEQTCDALREYDDLGAEPGVMQTYAVQARVACDSGGSGLTVPVWAFGAVWTPAVARSVVASEDLIDTVLVEWDDPGPLSSDSFFVLRNGARIGAVASDHAATHYRYAHLQATPAFAEFTVQGWSTLCGPGEVSAGDSGDIGLDAAPENGRVLPLETRLLPTYPNPFNATVTIPLAVATAGELHVSVINILGREVASLYHGALEPGLHRLRWTPHCGSGVYFVSLTTTEGTRAAEKILYLR
ncbi:T9SS type A sorting domain-containing protein [candidate division KSB1 bacterium]|nr:T9SS type A sorting domain-containing protein [candidate division KSB1 bacterium]